MPASIFIICLADGFVSDFLAPMQARFLEVIPYIINKISLKFGTVLML